MIYLLKRYFRSEERIRGYFTIELKTGVLDPIYVWQDPDKEDNNWIKKKDSNSSMKFYRIRIKSYCKETVSGHKLQVKSESGSDQKNRSEFDETPDTDLKKNT